MSQPEIDQVARDISADPDVAPGLCAALPSEALHHLSASIKDELRARAINAGDFDAIIEDAFAQAFGRDGLGSTPWIEGEVIVCPGSIVAKSRASHRCRFVSINDVWIWDSAELIREEKQSHPGKQEGFKAVALVPVMEGLALDVVSGRARGGQHQVDRVISFEVRQGTLVEVSQRSIKPADMH